ncbi:Tetraspanin family [Rhizoctonia solani]|uniref:ATP synthase subunit d, mitochondrial n=1 Tax=Rhizoctonia solani TaxID=456999 RepID=A0A8H7ILD4_9AGAM|nr:Tetraspanin family [Rhizoctonia solani]
MASKSLAAAIDWTRIYGSLGLGKETVASLQAFRKRHSEAQRVHSLYATQPTTVNIAHYRSVLKNQAVVDEAERILREFKPVSYDVNEHVKAIEAFEAKAVAKAEETSVKIDEELGNLQKTLANIEEARPFEDLTVEDVAQARPEIVKTVETMMKKGKFSVPGYKEKFGDLSMVGRDGRGLAGVLMEGGRTESEKRVESDLMGFGNHNHYYSGTSLSTHPHRRTVSSGVSGFTISAYTSPSPPPTSASPLVTPPIGSVEWVSIAVCVPKELPRLGLVVYQLCPAKFSRPHSPGIHNRKGAKGAEPKRGGGLDAFGQGHNRMADRDDEDYEGVQFGSGPGWSSNKKPRLRWNRFKWILFILNILLTIYTLTGLIFCLLTWFNVWTHADIVRVGNTTELILSTVAASFGLLTSVIGWSGILLNNRAFLAVYTLFLWITFGLLVAPGYVTYKKKTFNLEGKINAQWSTGIGLTGRLRIQNQLHCCGYFSPYVEATISQTCYSRSPLPGCKGEYLRFERKVLTSWYTVAFALVPLQLACMVGSLLCANHVTYRFGKGMMPKAYRLDLNSMAVIMDNYAQQLAEQYGDDVASEIMAVLARIFRLTRKATGQFAMPRPRPTTSPRSLVREDMVRSLTQAATTTSADKRPVSILSHLYKFTTAPRPSSAIDKLLNMTCVHRSSSPD